jgi:hypothetical protein
LGYGGLEIDRNGRTLAHLYLDGSNEWIQGAMISAGMARVYTWPDNRSCAAELIARERAARDAKRGIWALPYYRIRTPTELNDEIDTFQIVEGQVVSADEARGRAFLNFGADYKTDFTVTIAPEDMKTLFTRFGRLPTEANVTIPGTGLGLFLCREIAGRHGGEVTVRSAPGQGSEFTLTLPSAG